MAVCAQRRQIRPLTLHGLYRPSRWGGRTLTVLESQRAFAARAGQWQNDYMVDFKMAYNHYFGAGAKKG